MTARWITLWFFLLLLHCSACPEQNDAAQWTAERFDGNLSGVTVTVTRRVWEQGPLTVIALEDEEGKPYCSVELTARTDE